MSTLPLTVLEEYFHYGDRPSHPTRIIAKFTHSGAIDRPLFEEAVNQLPDYHPLLKSKLEKAPFGRLRWRIGENQELPIHWVKACRNDFSPRLNRLNLENGYSVEFHVVVDSSGWDAYLNISHAVSDGLAIIELWKDILLLYERARGNDTPKPNRDLALLDTRERGESSFRQRFRSFPIRLLRLGIARHFLARQPASLASIETTDPQSFQETPRFISTVLESDEFQRLKKNAKDRNLTLNDFCLGLLHYSIGRWLKTDAQIDLKDWIRISVPTNLRKANESQIPCCNPIGIVSIDRRRKSLADREHILRRAKEDMDEVKSKQLGRAFLSYLKMRRFLPGSIQKKARSTRTASTAVLSNIGTPFADSSLLDTETQLITLSDSTLQQLSMLPHYQSGTHATFMIHTYGTRFFIDLHYDHRALHYKEAKTLLSIFEEELTQPHRRNGEES